MLRAILPAGLILALLLAPIPAQAHKVSVFAYGEAGELRGEAYFAGGGKAQGTPVEIHDAAGKLVTTVTTGPDGTFSLPIPQATPPLKLVVKAGQGHQSEYTVSAADLGLKEAAATPAPAPAPPGPPEAAPAPVAPAPTDTQAVARAVAQVVDQRLAPLQAQIARLAAREDEVSLKDVIGGLGWIMGLLGAALYFSRPGRKA